MHRRANSSPSAVVQGQGKVRQLLPVQVPVQVLHALLLALLLTLLLSLAFTDSRTLSQPSALLSPQACTSFNTQACLGNVLAR